jgi:hypothetical protein
MVFVGSAFSSSLSASVLFLFSFVFRAKPVFLFYHVFCNRLVCFISPCVGAMGGAVGAGRWAASRGGRKKKTGKQRTSAPARKKKYVRASFFFL